jgi:hypothetical protein
MLTFSFKKKHSVLIKIWHWLTTCGIEGLLTTVLFRTIFTIFFNSSYNSKIVFSKLQKSETVISDNLTIRYNKVYTSTILGMVFEYPTRSNSGK